MSLSKPGSRQARSLGAGQRWLALAALMFPVLLISVDNTVLSFAVPSLSVALQPSGTELLWIIDVYALVLAGLLVPMGSIGDRIGRRKLLLIGATGFALVSVLASFATDAGQLIAARALLGVFGAMLGPATLSLIRNIFTDAAERRTAIAVWAAGFSGGAALGPLAGGLLLEHFEWGAVFLLAVPMLLPLLILAPLVVPESKDPNPSPVDPASILLVMAAMVPFVYGIKEFAHDGGPAVLLPLAVGLVSGVLFVRRQLRRQRSGRAPMLDMSLFRHKAFSVSLAANLLSIFSLVGFIYFMSQHLQLVAGRTPLEAGTLMLPGLALTIVAGLVTVPVVRRIRPAHVVTAGLLLNMSGYVVVLMFGQGGELWALLLGFAVVGAGVGAAETISNDLILASVPAPQAGAASAISETAYEVGSVMGTAVLGSILTAAYRSAVEVPSTLAGDAARHASETLGGAIDAAKLLPVEQAEALLESARHAFDSGVGITSAIGMVLMLAAAVMVAVVLRQPKTA
ncbi:MFS transporter [Arthrobacter sp. SW1]|nr:MFS transporter [Arthrobacter sp. SW1]